MRVLGLKVRNSVVATAILLATVAGVSALPVFAAGSRERKHDVKKQVEALEEQWRTARLTGDVATMDRLLAEDYIGISMTGQVSTKPQQLERARNRRIVLTRLDLGDVHVKVIGAIAIVTSRADVEVTHEGMSVKGTYRYTRVYRRLPDGNWKITSFEATRVPKSRESLDAKRDDTAKSSQHQPINEPQ